MTSGTSAPASRRTRLVVLGGFLGAGKTTTLLRLAREIVARGRTVGIVTNDQGEELVDTELFRAAGFATRDVRGGCFCCRLDDFIAQAGEHLRTERPDYLLAEPVGSCTDLVATVLRPLATLHTASFSLAPYCVLVDPVRALDALGPRGKATLSEKVTYIYGLQQMEADTLVLTKTDAVPREVLDEVEALLAARYEGKRIMRMSAATGKGFAAFESLLLEQERDLPVSPEIDYDTYAEGEAELAWFDGRYLVRGSAWFQAPDVAIRLAELLRARLAARGVEIAHLKVAVRADEGHAVASVSTNAGTPALLLASGGAMQAFEVVVNVRARGEPGAVEQMVAGAVEHWGHAAQASVRADRVAAFSPARPAPSVRLG